ncbi:MAG: sulfurtransferase TusA family protein [Treponema sp.]|nr:sulfurtransferase TusA family protein [Treponema sp.]
MKKVVDACGLACPEPVLMLKGVIDSTDEIELLVDAQVCVEMCSRFAVSKGFSVAVHDNNGLYTLTLTKT